MPDRWILYCVLVSSSRVRVSPSAMPTTRPVRVSALDVVVSTASAMHTRTRLKSFVRITGLHSMADQSDLQQYYRLANILIEQAGKEQLAQCARLLALNLAHYQGKFGEMPLEDTLAILDATEPNHEQEVLLRDGMEILVGLLGGVLSGLGEEKH